MKRLIIFAVVVSMSIGCAGVFQTVCHPTAEQTAMVQNYKAQAETILAFLSTQFQDSTVLASIRGLRLAISVYDQIISGVCVAVEVVQGADATVTANKTMAMKRLGFKH